MPAPREAYWDPAKRQWVRGADPNAPPAQPSPQPVSGPPPTGFGYQSSAANQVPQFQAITPEEVGLPTFDVINTMPNLTDAQKQQAMTHLSALDAAKAAGASNPNAAAQFQSQLAAFQNFWQGLVASPDRFVSPASAPPVQGAPPDGSGVASVAPPSPAPTPDGSLTGGLDLGAEIQRLLGQFSGPGVTNEDIQRILQGQLTNITEGLTAQGVPQEYQDVIESEAERFEKIRQEQVKRDERFLRGRNLQGAGRRSSRVLDVHANRLEEMLGRIQTTSRDLTIAGLQATERQRSQAHNLGTAFVDAIQSGNVAMAEALIRAREVDLQADMTQQQFSLQKEIAQHNMLLERDTFTEDQRRAMVDEGFTEEQINQAEEQGVWYRAFQERQQTASEGLAQQNIALQYDLLASEERGEAAALDLEKIKSYADISLNDRMFDLQSELQLDQARLGWAQFNEEKGRWKTEFDAMEQKLEREFGLEVNRFALEEYIRTGQLDLAILDTQQRFDLAKEEQARAWFATRESLDIQRTLGMGELELKGIIAGEEISLAREGQALERWMFEQGLAWDRERFNIQLQEARKKKKGSCLKSTLGAVVGAGVGFVTGGPVGALMGGAQVVLNDLGQGDTLGSIVDLTGRLAPGPMPGTTGTTSTSALGDWTPPSFSGGGSPELDVVPNP